MREILESFQIAHLRGRSPREISGGEQQRVALARSLVTEPSVLLLDEPLSSLDPGTKVRIIEDLQRWNETRRIPILYVTHDHGEVLAMGDRVLALEQGRIVAEGCPSTWWPRRLCAWAWPSRRVSKTSSTPPCSSVGSRRARWSAGSPAPRSCWWRRRRLPSVRRCAWACGRPRSSSRRRRRRCSASATCCRARMRRTRARRGGGRGTGRLRRRHPCPARRRAADAAGLQLAAEVWLMIGPQSCQLVRPVSLDSAAAAVRLRLPRQHGPLAHGPGDLQRRDRRPLRRAGRVAGPAGHQRR